MSDLVAAVTLEFVAGDDILLEFTVTRDDEAVDISGMTCRFAVARGFGEDPVLSTADGTATATVTDGESGVFQVAIDGSNTESLSGDYRYEAEIEDASGDKQTVARGFASFVPSLL